MAFISDLASFGGPAQWSVSIKIDADQQVTASIMLLAGEVSFKDKLPGMRFKGTAEQIDQQLKESFEDVVLETKAFFQNREAYKQSLETARKKTLEEQKNRSTTASINTGKPGSGKAKQFEALMNKVQQLEKDGKIGQAIAQLPKIKDFPEFEAKINERTKELKQKHGGFSLFEQESLPDVTPQPESSSQKEPPAEEELDQSTDQDEDEDVVD